MREFLYNFVGVAVFLSKMRNPEKLKGKKIAMFDYIKINFFFCQAEEIITKVQGKGERKCLQ